MKFEKEFAQLLFRNAVIFIDSAIGYINKGLDSYVNMLQAIVNLQFAMELFQKYRNCVLHSAYVFSEQERRDAEKDITVLIVIMTQLSVNALSVDNL